MPWTETYLGVLGEDRYNIPPSSVKDSVQDKEWKRKIRQGHEEFPCTSTRAARKLEADQKRWGKVMLLFFWGWEGLKRAGTHSQRECRKLQADIELDSLENQELF